MMPWCSHRVTWDLDCAKCDVEEAAWDPSTINRFFETRYNWEKLCASRDGREADEEQCFLDAVGSWSWQSKKWSADHQHHDVGGEA